MDVFPPKRRFHISLSAVSKIWRKEEKNDLQLFARGGDYVLGMRKMRVPLHIGNVPSSALRKETGNSVKRLKIEYKKTPPT